MQVQTEHKANQVSLAFVLLSAKIHELYDFLPIPTIILDII